MARRPAPVQFARDRHDYGALEVRVTSLDAALENQGRATQSSLSDMRTDTVRQFDAVRRDFADAIGGVREQLTALSTDMKNQVSSGRTHWVPLLGTVATMATVLIATIGVVGSMALSPIRDDAKTDHALIQKLIDESVRKTDYSIDLIKQQSRNIAVEGSVVALREETVPSLNYLHGQIDERQLAYLRDLLRIETRVDSIDGNLVKRPEIEAAARSEDQRYTALSSRLNALTEWLQQLFPANEVIKDIQEQLRELRTQQSAAPTPVPILPATPMPLPQKN